MNEFFKHLTNERSPVLPLSVLGICVLVVIIICFCAYRKNSRIKDKCKWFYLNSEQAEFLKDFEKLSDEQKTEVSHLFTHLSNANNIALPTEPLDPYFFCGLYEHHEYLVCLCENAVAFLCIYINLSEEQRDNILLSMKAKNLKNNRKAGV
jgi:hypothetical protein